jgi:hypothetical protein
MEARVLMDKSNSRLCSICGESFHTPPCSAHPVTPGVCCQRCDDLIVTPVRILRARPGTSVLATFAQAIEMHRISEQYRRKHKPG